MARRSIAPAILSVLLLVGGVTACGDDPQADYCSAVRADREAFADMLSAPGPTTLLKRRTMLGDLAGQAPEDLTDEWQTFLNALDGLQDALDAADVAPADFKDGRPPSGLTPAQRGRITDAATRLADRGTVAAVDGIEQQARDVCKVNLGM